MLNIEEKKFKGLGLNLLFLAMFLVHVLAMAFTSFDHSFQDAPYPYLSMFDAYLLFSLIFNPIFISSIIKKVVEIEEKNNMWAMQVSLGLSLKNILFRKLKLLSLRFILLHLLEAIAIFVLGQMAGKESPSIHIVGRIGFLIFTLFLINVFFLVFFTLIEMHFSKVYFSPLFSILGALSGIITMLTSKTLSLVNPFAWPISLMSLSFEKEGDHFIQVLNPTQVYTLPFVFICLCLGLYVIKKDKSFSLTREV